MNDREHIKKIYDNTKDINQISNLLRNNKDLQKSLIELTSFLDNKVLFMQRLYHVVNDLDHVPKCLFCDNDAIYVSISKGYRKICRDKKCIKHLFSINSKKSNATIDKLQVNQKRRETFLKNYGVDHPFKSEIIKDKIKKTNLEKFGAENVFKSYEIQKKIKETNLIKYGVDNPQKCITVKEKTKETNLIRYGVDSPAKLPRFQVKPRQVSMQNGYERAIERIIKENKLIPLFDKSEWKGHLAMHKFRCKTCDTIFEDYPYYNFIAKCPKCNPKYTSSLEIKIREFLDEYHIEYEIHNRNILSDGKELDIFIPKHSLAIECDGIYWHSTLRITDQKYHYKKYLECKENKIQLLRFFEDEITNENKFDIIKSMILHRIKSSKHIYARNTQIVNINKEDAKIFLLENHLQGYRYATNFYGLLSDNVIYSLIGFNQGNPKFINSNVDSWEIVRFATKKYHSVVGGFSKLIKHFQNQNINAKIHSYLDLRYSDVNNYKNWKINDVSIGYYYWENLRRLHRFNFTKHNLIELCNRKNIAVDVADTEATLAEKVGLVKVYDSGQIRIDLNSK